MIDLRMPHINGTTDKEQLGQIRSYLYQLTEQLQWALNAVEAGTGNEAVKVHSGIPGVVITESESEAQNTFNSIKSLIIKSADIVEAYYEKINQLLSLSGQYVASSDFGEYREQTDLSIEANSQSIQTNISKIETISSEVDELSSLRERESYLKFGAVGTTLDSTGIATEDAAGIEIGDYTDIDGEQTKRYARFTAYGVELFGSDKDKPAAYVSLYTLHIMNAVIKGTLTLGGYQADTTRGIAFKWVGV